MKKKVLNVNVMMGSNKYNLLLNICLPIILCLESYSTESDVITKRVYEDVLLNSNYTSQLLPICQAGGNVTVRLQLALRQIMDVDEVEQIVTVNAWFRMTWNDCRLKWNASNYNGITHFYVPYSSMWIPDITLYDSAADEVMMPGKEMYAAAIYNDGSVRYNFPTVLKSICRIDVKYFPFDTQDCTLTLGSWSHHGYELDVQNSASKGDLDSYINHSEWDINAFPIKRHVLYYNCCPEPYPDVTFYLKLKRKASFYVLTVLFPCILTGFVGATSFILPPDSGEKVSLSITVLLSYVVFMLMISEQLPASSDTFPYIGMYFASSMTLVALSCFMTVMVLNIHYRGNNGRKVSRWIRMVVINILGRLVCSRKNTRRFYITHTHVSPNVTQVMPETENSDLDDEENVGNGHIPNSTSQSQENCEKDADINTTTEDRISKPKWPISGILRKQSVVLDKLEKKTEKEKKNVGNGHIPISTNRENSDGMNTTTQDRISKPKWPISGILRKQSVVLDKLEKKTEKEKVRIDNIDEWHEAAFIMDRVFLLIYIFTASLTFIIFIAKMTSEH